jgi:hypothetical protein
VATLSPKPSNPARYIRRARAFVAIGLLGLAFASILAWRTERFIGQAMHTQGVVVDFHVYPPSGGSRHSLYRPVIQFTDRTGNIWRVLAGTSDYPPAFKIGQKVPVLYAPDNPLQMCLNTVSDVWGDTIGAAVISGFATVLGLVMVAVLRHLAAGPEAPAPWWDRYFAPLKIFTWFLSKNG